MQKEFGNLLSAISKWEKANRGQVVFIGSFISLDPKKIKENADDCFLDDIMVGYGDKKSVEICLDGISRALKGDKKKFINW